MVEITANVFRGAEGVEDTLTTYPLAKWFYVTNDIAFVLKGEPFCVGDLSDITHLIMAAVKDWETVEIITDGDVDNVGS